MDVKSAVDKLVRERVVDEEFFNFTAKIAEFSVPACQSLEARKEDAQAIALDFLVALASEDISGYVSTAGDLKRELRRWLTRRDSPEKMELWSVISAALLYLEKKGIVFRPGELRQFRNNNRTQWFLKNNAGKNQRLNAELSLAESMPVLGAKGGKDKILSPGEARDAVLAVLKTFGGEVPMSQIFKVIASRLPVFKISRSMDAMIESGFTETDMHERLESTAVAGDYTFLINEERDHAVANIWRETKTVRHGRASGRMVEGIRILCCYVLPKDAFGEKVVLESFGPVSTVQDVAKKVRAILAKWMYPEKKPGESAFERWIHQEISGAVLSALMQLCSENGCCAPFYDNMRKDLG